MTVSVEFVVTCREQRLARALALARDVGARVVADPRPDLPATHSGTWRTARAAWLGIAAAGAEYGLVLQDDVLVCPRFREIAEHVLTLHAWRVVTFYSPASVVLDAFAAGAPMVELGPLPFLQTQAMAIPGPVIAGFVAAGDRMSDVLADDERLGRFLRVRDERALATVPSLAQHDPDEPTIIPGKRTNAARHARLYVCDTAVDPATRDWSGPVHRGVARPERSHGGWRVGQG